MVILRVLKNLFRKNPERIKEVFRPLKLIADKKQEQEFPYIRYDFSGKDRWFEKKVLRRRVRNRLARISRRINIKRER